MIVHEGQASLLSTGGFHCACQVIWFKARVAMEMAITVSWRNDIKYQGRLTRRPCGGSPESKTKFFLQFPSMDMFQEKSTRVLMHRFSQNGIIFHTWLQNLVRCRLT